jgi:hypothetical protein
MCHVKVTAGACRNAMRMSDKGDRHCLCEKRRTSFFFGKNFFNDFSQPKKAPVYRMISQYFP